MQFMLNNSLKNQTLLTYILDKNSEVYSKRKHRFYLLIEPSHFGNLCFGIPSHGVGALPKYSYLSGSTKHLHVSIDRGKALLKGCSLLRRGQNI